MPFQVAAEKILLSAKVPIQVGVKVCTPFTVPIVRPKLVSVLVAKVWVEEVEPFKEVMAAKSQEEGVTPLTVVKLGVEVTFKVTSPVKVPPPVKLVPAII